MLQGYVGVLLDFKDVNGQDPVARFGPDGVTLI